MLVGEDDNIDYMGNGDDELHLVFNFPLMRMGRLTPARIRSNQKERFARLDRSRLKAGPAIRSATMTLPVSIHFFGDKQHDAELARLHAG